MDSSNGLTHPEFVDEVFRITPEYVVLPPAPGEAGAPGGGEEAGAEGEEISGAPAAGIPAGAPLGAPPGALAPVPDLTEEDCLFLSEALWSLPNLIIDRVPVPNPEKVRKWNAQLFRYCVRKGINPYDYIFDELPLVLATAALAGEMWKGYKASAPPEEKKKAPVPAPGDEDYAHRQEVDRKLAEDLEKGKIRVAPATSAEGAPPVPAPDQVHLGEGGP
jgi:hypothetical protein